MSMQNQIRLAGALNVFYNLILISMLYQLVVLAYMGVNRLGQ